MNGMKVHNNQMSDNSKLEEISASTDPSGYQLNTEVIIDILKKLPNGKSAGESKVSNEMFKYCSSDSLPRIISKIMETIINTGIIPRGFNTSIIKPLIKDGKKPTDDLNNIRPISLSDTMTNIFEKVILYEIMKIHPSAEKQFGFKPNSSCGHAVFTLTETIKQAKLMKKKVYVAAIDASKAFDKVNRMILWNLLLEKTNSTIELKKFVW